MKVFATSFLSLCLLFSLVNGDHQYGHSDPPRPSEDEKYCQPSVRGSGCKPGYTCVSGNPAPGAAGYCVKDSGLGETCGGATKLAPRCKTGLKCYIADNQKKATGRQGQCRPLAKKGQPCGGSVQFPPVCDDGLQCITPRPRLTNPPKPIMVGRSGKCVEIPKYD